MRAIEPSAAAANMLLPANASENAKTLALPILADHAVRTAIDDANSVNAAGGLRVVLLEKGFNEDKLEHPARTITAPTHANFTAIRIFFLCPVKDMVRNNFPISECFTGWYSRGFVGHGETGNSWSTAPRLRNGIALNEGQRSIAPAKRVKIGKLFLTMS